MVRIKNCKGKKFNEYVHTVINTKVFEYKAGLADPELEIKCWSWGKKMKNIDVIDSDDTTTGMVLMYAA